MMVETIIIKNKNAIEAIAQFYIRIPIYHTLNHFALGTKTLLTIQYIPDSDYKKAKLFFATYLLMGFEPVYPRKQPNDYEKTTNLKPCS